MLSSLTIGLISAACIFGGALLGLLLQGLLPQHHLRDNSKDTVKVVAGTIATLSALVLGLLVGSAKNPSSAIALVSARSDVGRASGGERQRSGERGGSGVGDACDFHR